MNLDDEEQAMLAGERGSAVQQAIRLQVSVGDYFGARDMVRVGSVHISGDVEELGDAGVEYLERMGSLGASCVVPTLTDPRGAELRGARLRQDPAAIEIERRTIAAYGAMNFRQCNNCIIYQTTLQPRRGEHLAWGDTGSVIYANSVFGARSNFEAGPSALAASLTGRTPRYGFHLDGVRKANVVVQVEGRISDLAEWGALGCVVGRQMRGYWDVPVFTGLEDEPDSDALKHLGAALASFGSTAMFHIAGLTPEAATLSQALSDARARRELIVPTGGLEEAFARFDPPFGKVDLVVFSAPQLSAAELASVADAFAGREVHEGVRVFVTAPSEVVAVIEADGVRDRLQAAGVEILVDVCFYLMTPRLLAALNSFSTLVTNSAKLANIMTGHGYAVKLRRLSRCVDAALRGVAD
jgi:predicted aconitase